MISHFFNRASIAQKRDKVIALFILLFFTFFKASCPTLLVGTAPRFPFSVEVKSVQRKTDVELNHLGIPFSGQDFQRELIYGRPRGEGTAFLVHRKITKRRFISRQIIGGRAGRVALAYLLAGSASAQGER